MNGTTIGELFTWTDNVTAVDNATLDSNVTYSNVTYSNVTYSNVTYSNVNQTSPYYSTTVEWTTPSETNGTEMPTAELTTETTLPGTSTALTDALTDAGTTLASTVLTHAATTLTTTTTTTFADSTVAGDGVIGDVDVGVRTHSGIPASYIWLPYVIFSMVLVGLMIGSFVRFHKKNGHKYKRRRAELWRQLNMQKILNQVVSTATSPPNGGVPAASAGDGRGRAKPSTSKAKPRKSRRPLVFNSNLNGSMVDVRCGLSESLSTFRTRPPHHNAGRTAAPPPRQTGLFCANKSHPAPSEDEVCWINEKPSNGRATSPDHAGITTDHVHRRWKTQHASSSSGDHVTPQ